MPKFDVIYIADSKTTGITHFQINSSVEINPLYHESDLYWMFFNYWEIRVKRNNKTVSVPVDFKVNWDHLIFIGARTVNLQLGSVNNLCLSYDKDSRVSAEPCDLKNIQQAFVYDALGRYVAAKNMTLCLDAENLTRLEECNSNLSERWYWDKENRYILKNEWKNKILIHRKTGESGFKSDDEANQDEGNNYSHKTLSAYMQL